MVRARGVGGLSVTEHAQINHGPLLLGTGTLIRPPPDTAAPLTVSAFKRYPATGTMGDVAYLNDDVTNNIVVADTVDMYADVNWGVPRRISEYRQFGYTANLGTGRWKIQYWDGSSWVDWVTEIPTRKTADWSSWTAPAAGPKTTEKIRLVCTTVDNPPYGSMIAELEIRSDV